jgi:hypothetical protein
MTEVLFSQLATIKEEPIEFALNLVYNECINPENVDPNTVAVTIQQDDYFPNMYHYTLTENSDYYPIREIGTATIDDMHSAVLVETTESEGDPIRTMVNLDNSYLYYFH